MIFNYCRVSSITQNTVRQLDGVPCDRCFEDKVSGKSLDRPELNKMMDILRAGDIVNVHSLDRLARNVKDLLNLVEDFQQKGVTLIFHKENLTFNAKIDDPYSKMLLGVLGAVAEFERAIIRERQKEGIEIAKKKGAYAGRPRKLNQDQVNEIKAILKENPRTHYTQLSKQFNISRFTLYKYIDRINKEKNND